MTQVAPTAHLDVRNLMWLLAAMVFVVAPHMLRLPSWVGIFFIVIVGWRAWISWAALRSPPRAFMWIVTIAATLGTFQTYGRIFGREAGVTLLIIMAALKLLEMRNQRDVVLCIYLGFFLVITNFLFSQSIPLGIYMLACVWIFVATMVGFSRIGRAPTLMERLRPAGMLLVQALPLMVAFFILFPRMPGPLWALPQDSRSGQTGLTDSMSPGNITNLIKSDSIAFRVHFEDQLPPYQSLYWRGPVLAEFDGGTWRMSDLAIHSRLDFPVREQPTRYTVTLEPHNKGWMFALDVPGEVPSGAYILADLQMRSYRPVNERIRYELTSYLKYQYGHRPAAVTHAPALKFDPGRNPRTIALGRQWAQEDPDPRSILSKAGKLFATGYTYTLEPPSLDRVNPYDDFLFNARQGFCEHYAGSFVLLMRAAGIPARVVTGYQGGEVNPLNNELIVRQADAHAWAEVWVPQEGWVRIDPTATVSPTRVENGVNAALGPIGVVPSLIAADPLGLLANMRFAWQMMNSNWNEWVVGYNVERQRQFFSRFGFARVDWRTLAFWLMIATFAVGGAVTIGLVVRERPPKPEPSLSAWNQVCARLAEAGLAREPHEGPLDFLRRVAGVRPDLATGLEEITRRYVDARYGAGASRDELRALQRLARDFRPA